jgi:5'-nucleotidase / UDP-sugar diphosphatase
MKLKVYLLIPLLSFIIQSSAQNSVSNDSKISSSDTTHIIILSVNDQHAKIDSYGKFKALVDKIKSENKHVVLFSAGDNFTGNPIVDQYHDKGFPIIDLMNNTGFHASAVGNHEFDYGQDVLEKRIKQANFPFLSANIRNLKGDWQFKPYEFINIDSNITIGIVSAIQLGVQGIPDSHPDNLKDLVFNDGVQEISKLSFLRDSCTIFIALTHLGFEKDIELAESIPQLHMILGGHTHTLTKPSHKVNGVQIMQAGSGLRNIAKATVSIVNGRVVKVKPEMLSISDFTETDKEIELKLVKFNDNKELNRVIGRSAASISGNDELGSMMTDAITALESVDIAFQNNGGIRIDNLAAGDISIKNIYQLDPFGNEIIVYKMKPSEIKTLILNSYRDAENSIDLQVSGMTYTVITDNRNNPVDVEILLPNGKKPARCKKFNVGMNSYIASSYKFNHKDHGRSLYITTAENLINYLKNNKDINYQGVKRAFVEQSPL